MKNKALVEALLLAAAGVLGWIVAVNFDAMDHLIELMELHEDWQLDELIAAIFLVGLLGFVYAARRLIDMRHEVKKREAAESDASWIARHDPLTSLPNRRYLQEFAASRSGGATSTVLVIDLDGFKRANDLLGHAAGDEVLCTVAKRLSSTFPKALILRYGGDEFVLITTDTSPPAPLLAQEVISLIGRPVRASDAPVEIGASVGIATSQGDLNLAIDEADIALYVAKRAGRNTAKTFDPAMREYATQRALLEQALRKAIRQGDIVPYYQPLVDLATGHLTGFEALARWQRDDGTFTPPDVFITLAEEGGIITDLFEQLLRTACRDAAGWSADITLAFNLSPTQLTDKLLGLRIIKILNETGLSPRRLEVEITESALVRDLAVANAVLGDLRAAGVRVALDDFGTGFSSLSQLTSLAFDRIKIDRSFIDHCEGDEKRLKVIKAILTLGHGLDLVTTAEGIETESQRQLMEDLGCDTAQGYLFSPALPASELGPFLLDHPAHAFQNLATSKSTEP